MNLRAKIFLPLFFFSTLLFAYLYWYWIPQSVSQAESEYHEATERHIDSVIEGIVPLLLSDQLDTIHESLNTLMRKNKYWLSLQVTGPSGKIIYPLQSLSVPEVSNRPYVHTFEKQIGYLDTKLGKLVLKEDWRPRLDAIRKGHRKLTFTLLVGVAVFFLCIGIVLERVVSRPTRVLADLSKKLARGNFDPPALKAGRDEIGRLAECFIDMCNSIRGYQADLLRKNESMHEEHEFLQKIIESLTQPFYVIDAASYRVVLANKVANNGCAIPKDMTCHRMTHGRDVPCAGDEHPCSIAEVKKTKMPAVLEHVHFGEKGEKRTYEIYAYPIFDKNGGVNKVIEYCIDITEKKNAEEEHEKMAAQLLQMQKMEAIGTLAGGIAHDFNNILTAMIGYCDLARYSVPEKSNLHEMLGKILNAGNRARNLVQQILSFSRQTEQIRMPVKIQNTVNEALNLLRASMPATIEIRSNIEECGTVFADTTQIHQVVMNLCTNAYHAMRKTGGVLGVSLKQMEINRDAHTSAGLVLSPGQYVKLEVSDTGHGIKRELLNRIFEPFYTTKEKGEGTGMGLAVVHGIVKSHKGHITVYSEPNIGTTFNVYLPVFNSVQGEDKDDSPQNVNPSFESLPGGHERIMFVDDEEVITTMGQQILEKLGYSVSAFTNPVSALEFFKARPGEFDLVITDMTMPQMTGTELAVKVLAIQKDIPVILCTGFSELISGDSAKALGIREYVMKPMLISEIAVLIRKVLDGK